MNKTVQDKLYLALAKMVAAFPAGEYHFNEKQNLAMNELGDVSSELRHTSKKFEKLVKKECDLHHIWILEQLVAKGIITKQLMDEELLAIKRNNNGQRLSWQFKTMEKAGRATKGSSMRFV